MPNFVLPGILEKFTTKKDLREYLLQIRATHKTIGFVATLGALHKGHLSLIKQAQQTCDVVVCSIFVNPSQFNDPKDLERYPRPLVADMQMLEAINCDVLFNPPVNEIYDDNAQWHLDIGGLEHILEGKFRPGHYQGVTQVVFKLFNIVEPDMAFFGQKDYQQYLIINKMVKMLNIPVKMVMCAIEREPDGLAMSSRNIHLTPEDRQHALILSKTLNWVKANFDRSDISQLKNEAELMLKNEAGVEAEYFEIADGDTLLPGGENPTNIVALVAAWVGKTRLIDNVLLVHGS
ncbi:MAG: pantoate--beta-alanine ligase [Chitinophagaceae bacterium]|nr:pantoate--beta-alanine ligase [Chitinophagaceae bacterium]